MTKRVALITGIDGQDGSYLAELLVSKGYDVHGLIRKGVNPSPNIDVVRPYITLHYGDLANENHLSKVIHSLQPHEVYNLGGQSDVAVSFEIPEYTGDVTGLGVTRMLEAIRCFSPNSRFYQASSSEMFGNYSAPPQNELSPMRARSPYSAAKIYAHNMTICYRESYNLFACSGICFNHECLTDQTPVIVRTQPNIIQIRSIEELVPHREDPSKGKKYTTVCDNDDLEIWDDGKWSKVKTKTATWNESLSDSDKSIKSVNCRGGYYEATAYHKSFKADKTEIPTYQLGKGDKLHLSEYPNLTETISISIEESELLGMLTADGYIGDRNCRFTKTSQELRDRVKYLWTTVTGGTTKNAEHPSGYNNSTVPSVELTGAPLYTQMVGRELYNEKRFKQVPMRVINSKRESIVAYLRGYNNCDGLKSNSRGTYEFKCFTTNSQVLAAGLWYLVDRALGQRITSHPEFRNGLKYYHLNINTPDADKKVKGRARDISEVKGVEGLEYTGWLFDLETDSGTFSAGVGKTWVHNSERRGINFVTRKITNAVARIYWGKQKTLELGNLDARRDWGYSPNYIEAMWLMLQEDKPDDYVIGSGVAHSVRDFAEAAFNVVALDWRKYVVINPHFMRPAEVNYLCADASKAEKVLGWKPKTAFTELVRKMVENDLKLEKPIE
jgi:GDPmannose 4,6-dehydratase